MATPIGNLEDITYRAVRTLREADLVICEDSRRGGMLLKHLGISKPLRTYHDHTPEFKEDSLVRELKDGAHAALITDGGTPAISDPGFGLIRKCIDSGIRIEGIPGPSALVNALATSGLALHTFTFMGYLPRKKGAREKVLQSLAQEERTLVFYESPHRLVAALAQMLRILGDREASFSREMTKKFEETLRGKLSELSGRMNAGNIRGEWTLVVAGAGCGSS